MNQPEFGLELIRNRKAKGLTQSELAEKCNVSKRTIQRIESGKVIPRSFTIKVLSLALEFDFLKGSSNSLQKKKETGHKRFILINQLMEQTIELFNLKTNTMKKLSVITVFLGLMGVGLFVFSNSSFAQVDTKFTDFGVMNPISEVSKKEAIKEIKEIQRKAKFHNGSIDIIEEYAEKSNYNFDTYILLCKLISSFGHSTKPAMEIANIVFLTYKDCNLFNEIAPLIFLNNHNTNNYVELARDASEAKTDADINVIKKQTNKYKEESEFKTLKDAFNNQNKF
jgi:transcriptional regulator with XRE-family HTH domain